MYIVLAIVNIAIEVLFWLIIIRVILSWIKYNPLNPIIRFIVETTEFVLAPLRRILPASFSTPVDWSPLLAIILLQVIQFFLGRLLT